MILIDMYSKLLSYSMTPFVVAMLVVRHRLPFCLVLTEQGWGLGLSRASKSMEPPSLCGEPSCLVLQLQQDT